MQGVLHHGLDILSFKESYSVADFQTFAKEKIDEIHANGKLPLIVGGGGGGGGRGDLGYIKVLRQKFSSPSPFSFVALLTYIIIMNKVVVHSSFFMSSFTTHTPAGTLTHSTRPSAGTSSTFR